ncbi:MAG: hypothetical protein J5449_09650 [Oscillospiraceae bacterium]|nr:hypothetical protein [Oscillospiraceae bacterium]
MDRERSGGQNQHAGHRARIRQKYLEHGIDVFSEHEVLEFILFYSLRQKDTNALAHALIKHFGSLEGVLAASVDELMEVDGVGEQSAVLLNMMVPVVRRAFLASLNGGKALGTRENIGKYLCELFFGMSTEMLFQICLDAKSKLLRCYKLPGGIDSMNLNMRIIVENALRCKASCVLLAHNHPSGLALPSAEDVSSTVAVYETLQTVGVELVDHFVVADGDFVSMRDNGMLPPGPIAALNTQI